MSILDQIMEKVKVHLSEHRSYAGAYRMINMVMLVGGDGVADGSECEMRQIGAINKDLFSHMEGEFSVKKDERSGLGIGSDVPVMKIFILADVFISVIIEPHSGTASESQISDFSQRNDEVGKSSEMEFGSRDAFFVIVRQAGVHGYLVKIKTQIQDRPFKMGFVMR